MYVLVLQRPWFWIWVVELRNFLDLSSCVEHTTICKWFSVITMSITPPGSFGGVPTYCAFGPLLMWCQKSTSILRFWGDIFVPIHPCILLHSHLIRFHLCPVSSVSVPCVNLDDSRFHWGLVIYSALFEGTWNNLLLVLYSSIVLCFSCCGISSQIGY